MAESLRPFLQAFKKSEVASADYQKKKKFEPSGVMPG